MKTETEITEIHRLGDKYFAVVVTRVQIEVSKEFYDEKRKDLQHHNASIFDESFSKQ